MAIGAASYKRIKIETWASEGERWLKENIPSKDLEFATQWDVGKLTITLTVYRKLGVGPVQEIFRVTEPAHAFVSHLTVTKILMMS